MSAVPAERMTALAAWLDQHEPRLLGDLADLVRLETVAPREERALRWCERYFTGRAAVRVEPAHPGLAHHPDANRNDFVGRADRATVSVEWPAAVLVGSVLLSAHVDVVPAGPSYADAFQPELRGRRLYGRGSADTKGNIVMVAAAMEFLEQAGVPHRRVMLDLVVEEEIGGNGALSTLLHGRDADGVVVLEPTGLEVFHGHRGCLEFTATVIGITGHMGGEGASAIIGAVDFVSELRRLEVELIQAARRDSAFRGYARPVQVNVGTIHGGEWHGSLAEKCVVTASLGFHPDTGLVGARAAVKALVDRLPAPWTRDQVRIDYTGIHNGAFLGDPESWLAHGLRDAVAATGARTKARRAWCVSCDARLYHEMLGVPVVIFGAGELDQAHTGAEYLDLDQWRAGVAALIGLLAVPVPEP